MKNGLSVESTENGTRCEDLCPLSRIFKQLYFGKGIFLEVSLEFHCKKPKYFQPFLYFDILNFLNSNYFQSFEVKMNFRKDIRMKSFEKKEHQNLANGPNLPFFHFKYPKLSF